MIVETRESALVEDTTMSVCKESIASLAAY